MKVQKKQQKQLGGVCRTLKKIKRVVYGVRTLAGSSTSVLLTSTTSPDTGEYTSEAAFTDSTTPKVFFCVTVEPTSGSST